MLKITTLGELTISIEDKPVGGFVSRKAEALLIYLAMNPHEHLREALSNLLWDDVPQNLALSYLRTVLASLQKQVTPYLKTTRHAIAINLENSYWVDALQLTQTLREKKDDFVLLEQVVSLYKGAFLQGFHIRNCREFENWMLLEQERIRTAVLQGCYDLGHYHFERQTFHLAMIYTAQALKLDPFWEKAHRQMMLLLAHTGQRTAALAQYETCVRVLYEELHIEPEQETVALFETIRT